GSAGTYTQTLADERFRFRWSMARQLHRREVDGINRDQLMVVAERGARNVQRLVERRGGLVVVMQFDEHSRQAVERRRDDRMPVPKRKTLGGEHLSELCLRRSVLPSGRGNQREVVQRGGGVRMILAARLAIGFEALLQERLGAIEIAVQTKD